jgi:hypothetical protein
MCHQHSGRAGEDDQVAASPHELPASARQVVQVLLDEHVHASCELVPIDEHTWAIHGSIAYEGEVILAEFDNRDDAELAAEELAASEDLGTTR